VEQLGAGSGAERVQAFTEPLLDVLEVRGTEPTAALRVDIRTVAAPRVSTYSCSAARRYPDE
jgi:hypothetical protein